MRLTDVEVVLAGPLTVGSGPVDGIEGLLLHLGYGVAVEDFDGYVLGGRVHAADEGGLL